MDATDLDDKLQTCPYDESHRIFKSRMQWHLYRCRKNHTGDKSNVKTCPYDATHIVPMMEYEYHVENCPKSGSILSFMQTSENPRDLGAVSMEHVKNVYVPPAAENWDLEPAAPKFDPLTAAKTKNVLIFQVGLSKAKKKKNRELERQRIQQLEDEGIFHNPNPKPERKSHDPDKPLRPVHKPAKSLSVASEPVDDLDDCETSLRPPRTKAKALSICSDGDYKEAVLGDNKSVESQKIFDRTFQEADKKNEQMVNHYFLQNSYNVENNNCFLNANDKVALNLSAEDNEEINKLSEEFKQLHAQENVLKEKKANLMKKANKIKSNASNKSNSSVPSRKNDKNSQQ